MAQKVQVLLVDDIDGGTADETVTFGLDGVTYEIDLTSAHASELRDAFAQWVGHARKVGGRTTAKSTAGPRTAFVVGRRAGDPRVGQGARAPRVRARAHLGRGQGRVRRGALTTARTRREPGTPVPGSRLSGVRPGARP